jgi:hypothetical protein
MDKTDTSIIWLNSTTALADPFLILNFLTKVIRPGRQ